MPLYLGILAFLFTIPGCFLKEHHRSITLGLGAVAFVIMGCSLVICMDPVVVTTGFCLIAAACLVFIAARRNAIDEHMWRLKQRRALVPA